MTQIAGVVLAAGGSTRFGATKQLLDWNGVPLVAHVTDNALAAGLEPVIVVLGHAAEKVHAALGNRPVRVAVNWRWQEGLSTSVRIGTALVPLAADGALFLQCDQPLANPHLLRRLVARFYDAACRAVYTRHDGQQRTPVLFARSLFPELSGISGDEGGRSIIARHAAEAVAVAVDDPDLVADIDIPRDYRRLKARAASRVESGSDATQTGLAGIRHLIVDMDGVLWRGDKPLPGLQDFFTFVKDRDIGFVLATNNASKTPEQYVDKLAQFDIHAPAEVIVTSAQATAAYLEQRAPQGTPLFFIGGKGLRDALLEQGFDLTDGDARYVVVGWDPDLRWETLAKATLMIRGGAGFIGTNPDKTFPREDGLVPGNGAQLAALEAASGVEPVIIGKPSPWLYREAMRRMGAEAETTAVIGDRLDTDIAGGLRVGLFTILLLSGITSEEELSSSPERPHQVYAHLEELLRKWRDETRD